MSDRFRFISTSTLRAMALSLAKRPWCWILRGFRFEVEAELLARDLPAIADDSGGFACVGIRGWQ